VTPEADVIYLDYAATTPVDPAVMLVMNACMGPQGDFGNPGSATHRFGHRAAARVEGDGSNAGKEVHASSVLI